MCSNTPGAGDHIQCEEQAGSTAGIDVDAVGVDIDFTGDGTDSAGVFARHLGSANVDINVSGRTNPDTTITASTIDTTGARAHGIFGQMDGDGAITFTLQNTEISTGGDYALGLWGVHRGAGDTAVDLKTGVVINTSGLQAFGASALNVNQDPSEASNAIFMTQGISVTTTGQEGHGIWARRQGGLGDARMTVRDSAVTTRGLGAEGVYGYKFAGGTGHVTIDVRNSTVRTESTATNPNGHTSAVGILGWSQSTGNIDIDVQGGSVTTAGTASHGVYGLHQGTGSIEIDLQGGAITTAGTFGYGILGWQHAGSQGDIDITTSGGHTITTTGPNGHGIVAYNMGTATSGRSIDITVGGSIDVSGTGARGVQRCLERHDAPGRGHGGPQYGPVHH